MVEATILSLFWKNSFLLGTSNLKKLLKDFFFPHPFGSWIGNKFEKGIEP
jgi:hypothetical protein